MCGTNPLHHLGSAAVHWNIAPGQAVDLEEVVTEVAFCYKITAEIQRHCDGLAEFAPGTTTGK